MNDLLKIQRIGWILQGVAGGLASVIAALCVLWMVLQADVSGPIKGGLAVALLLVVLCAYYFITRVSALRGLPSGEGQIKLFLQREYSWAVGAWCVVLIVFAYMANSLA